MPWAGRLVDRRGAVPVPAAALVLSLLSAGTYAFGERSPAFVVAATVLTNVAVQWSQIANQARVFAQLPVAGSRANSVYMVAVFLCGAVAAALATACYGRYGWAGVCAPYCPGSTRSSDSPRSRRTRSAPSPPCRGRARPSPGTGGR